ncbi:DUF5681 domain-containing protein [Allosphingosinicella deserti]|uniref:DUF5681 domain-containing protein n=1 Tax=Allosphingosinicella deserti TaxID=2116704 RepID=UPI001304C5E5|nr:DUF5681 domain-containing protein [Sphingomonas deserti]
MPDPATAFPRATTGQFLPGRSGNPAGRPRGARNKVSQLIELLNDGEEKALARAVVDRALAGDQVALRACFTRLVAPAKSSPVEIDLPVTATRADVAEASSALIAAMAAGEITPLEAEQAMKLLVTHSRLLDARDRSAGAAERAAEDVAAGSTATAVAPALSGRAAEAGPAAAAPAQPVATMPEPECCSDAVPARLRSQPRTRAPAPAAAQGSASTCISPVITGADTPSARCRSIGRAGAFPLAIPAERQRPLDTARPGRRATLLGSAAFDKACPDRHVGPRTDDGLPFPPPSVRPAGPRPPRHYGFVPSVTLSRP